MKKREITSNLDYKKSEHGGASHGLSNHSVYYMWLSMKRRCYDKKDAGYKNYGARGVTVCEEWKDAATFFCWAIENGYQVGKTLDRIDNNKGYYPDNCRFVSRSVNQKNRRVTIRYDVNGENRTISEWAAILDTTVTKINYHMLVKKRDISDIVNNKFPSKKQWDKVKAKKQGSDIKNLIKISGFKIGWIIEKMNESGFNINHTVFSNKISGERGFFTESEISFINKIIKK